jgi:hypothetical protein
MRSTTIIRGRFANGEGQKGNFTAYNSKAEQIFIHKTVMAEQGWKEDKDVPKQFYALIDERDIQTRDENGELTDVVVKRLSATAIFTSEEDLIKAYNADARLEVAIKQDLKAIASSAGLTEASMKSLLEVAI